MKTKNKTWFADHSHVGFVVLAATILMVFYVNWLPNEKIFPSVLVGLVVSHILIFSIALFGGWLLMPEGILKKLRKVKQTDNFDFGWSSKWNKGFGFASFIVLLLAFYSYFGLAEYRVLQFIAYTLLLLVAINFFIGNLIVKASNSGKGIILPYVNLFNAGKNSVLDAGCGAGRTTISLSKTAPDFSITAFDRFDANYIDDGGRELFKRNIMIAGIESRVNIVQGDITAMPFKENTFDASVSAYMFDHLGENKLIALKEMHRVLKPGGRFLMIIVVRGYSSFALANFMSLFFDTRKSWKKLFEQSGFILVDEGDINFGAYFLAEKR